MEIKINLPNNDYEQLQQIINKSGISQDLFIQAAIRKKVSDMKNLSDNKNAFDHILKIYQLNTSKKPKEVEEENRFCPIDNHKLIKVKIEDIVIDYCPTCFGIWFDHGELETLLKRKIHKIGGAGEVQADYGDDKLNKKCPVCDKPLIKKKYPNNDMHLDLCKHCGGIWLDGGEFAIIYSDVQKNHLKDVFAEIIKNYIDINT